jgi:hypothetical protein
VEGTFASKMTVRLSGSQILSEPGQFVGGSFRIGCLNDSGGPRCCCGLGGDCRSGLAGITGSGSQTFAPVIGGCHRSLAYPVHSVS